MGEIVLILMFILRRDGLVVFFSCLICPCDVAYLPLKTSEYDHFAALNPKFGLTNP